MAILVFTLMTFCPGDPAQIILGASASVDEINALRDTLGLNDPFIIRLGRFLADTFIRFDLGSSWMNQTRVASAIADRLPRTLALAIATSLLSIIIGVPLGVTAAVHQGGIGDNISMVLALIGISIPSFWLAMLLVLLFSVRLGWLPAMGIGGLKYYILPALAGCTGGIATLARQTRSSMLDVIRSDYITTARAKGVPENKVITKHALKNALIPIITVIGNQFGMHVGGTMVIETIFSIPGMGTLIVTAVNQRDYPVVQSGAIFLAISFSLIMLLVDLLYAAVDPRIKARYSAMGKRKKVKKHA
ncbi:MAG: ABC transporter permease [Firmicutes bacterium]|nr:ABC transporter permease [Bacillota bacterium]